MVELTEGVNWIAVIVGAVAAFALGWLWYSPVMFGKRWAEGVGVELGTADKMPVAAMASQLLGLFLVSWFVGVTAAANALATVILGTLAFCVLMFSAGQFTRKSPFVRNVEIGHWLASVILMIVIQGIF